VTAVEASTREKLSYLPREEREAVAVHRPAEAAAPARRLDVLVLMAGADSGRR
jgi:hypothetical protein